MSGVRSNFIEGFGDEIILTSVASIAIGFLGVTVMKIFSRRNAARRSATGLNSNEVAQQEELPANVNIYRRNAGDICAICLEVCTLAVETNCGHGYCGLCLKVMYEMNRRRAISCPFCRQRVTLLFLHLTQDERTAASDTELAVNRSDVIEFVHHYNSTHSATDRSIMDHLRDLPTLLRNLWSEFFTINGMLRFRFRVRIGFYCSILLFYLCVPFDIIPESIFGLLGFMDDLLISFVFLIYLAALYRRHILDRH
ncbi:hypothetical protein LSTR_LSTR015322 [Laodelphax striatellus]|uniref:E3 ubiquitin-protein ligase RNF170 n=1 Tax=Laodelphax striatellus TaxID=195883 RepID=A0A482WV32_LAOST|nr:hypothetical protein LSTR_LSTR015322 [Laodelphax striatellus]